MIHILLLPFLPAIVLFQFLHGTFYGAKVLIAPDDVYEILSWNEWKTIQHIVSEIEEQDVCDGEFILTPISSVVSALRQLIKDGDVECRTNNLTLRQEFRRKKQGRRSRFTAFSSETLPFSPLPA